MRSVEQRLTILGGAVVIISGLLWVVPAVNSIAAFAGMVATILIVARLGYARAILLSFVGLLLAFGTGSLTTGYPEGLYLGLLYILAAIAPALIMGWASRNLREPQFVIFCGLVPFAVILLFFIPFYADLMRNPDLLIMSLKSDLELVIKTNPAMMNLIKESYGAGDGAVGKFLSEFGIFIIQILKILPGFLVALLLGIAIFSFAVAGKIAVGMGIIISRFRPFHHWKASGWWLLPTIAGLIPVVFRMQELWFYAGVNILIVTGHVYTVVGLAVMEAFFKRALIQTPIKIIFYMILILAGPISMVFLAILGLSDTKFDFKREIEDFENKE